MDEIIEEIKSWIINFVEVKTSIFGNLPVCPFARKARIQNQINYVVTDLSNIDNIISNINDNDFIKYSTLLLIDTHNKIDRQTKEQIEDTINKKCPNNWAVYCLADEDLIFNGFKSRTNKYPIIIVTDLKEVEKAEASLHKTRYFDNWNEEHYKRLKVDLP